LAKPEKGTLQWLVMDQDPKIQSNGEDLQKEDFITWRDSSESCPLLVTAAPGQGKSVLSNFVVDHLKDFLGKLRKLHSHKVIYYFCNIKNEEISRTASSILRALIVQLCEDQRLFRNLPNRFQDKGQRESFHSAPFDDLWRTFDDLVTTDIYACIYCIIDGLDVYQTQMADLLSNLKRLMTRDHPAGTLLKLFCTSRPTKEVRQIEILPTKILRASSQDLIRFVNAHLERLKDEYDDTIKEVIRKQVNLRTGRTFLWISIILRRLEEMDLPSAASVEFEIKNRPIELENLYTGLMAEIFNKSPGFATILAWVAFAKRPLSLAELEVAIAVGTKCSSTSWKECSNNKPRLNVESVRAKLGTLVDIINNTPFLIHQSLRDFLLKPELWLQPPIPLNLKRPELLLADVCMTYLAFKEFEIGAVVQHRVRELKASYPLLSYAGEFWYQHIHSADEAREDVRKLQTILKGPNSQLWTSIRGTFWDSKPMSLCEIAIYYDIDWLANMLLNKISDDLLETFGNGCLIEAARSSPKVFKELLNHPEIKRIRATEDVVKAAARNWGSGKEVMMLLLEERGDEVKITEEVVKAVAGNRKSGKEVIMLLLEKRGDEVKITEEVVKAAAENGENGKEIMMLLLEERGDKVKITEEVVKAAAGNWGSGKEVKRWSRQQQGQGEANYFIAN
jgi:hypothetical protein